MIEDLFDDKPAPRAPAAEALFPLKDHPGVPWSIFTRQVIARLWDRHRVTTYSAAKLALTPAQMCALLDPGGAPPRPSQAALRLDQLVFEFRKRRGF
jgi:hypothetical protein